ncbi:hypothetical protein [uncultured Nostoc sp.]|uniref:hypothetical protein n=1 Tax=uncultured Nostoc sp. TaxID=340711 RepID=UPI0035CB4653
MDNYKRYYEQKYGKQTKKDNNNRHTKTPKPKSLSLGAKILITLLFTPLLFQLFLVITNVYLENNLERNIQTGLTLAAIVGVIVEHRVNSREK